MLPKVIFFITCVISGFLVSGKVIEGDVNLSSDKSDWKDPHDLFNESPFIVDIAPLSNEANCQESLRGYEEALNKLRIAYAELEKRRENSVDVLLKHILRQFLRDLEVNESTGKSIYKKAYVVLSDDNFDAIRRYLSSQKVVEEIALRERVRVALDGFLVVDNSYDEASWLNLFHRFLPYLLILNCILLFPALLIVIKSVLTIKQLIWFVFSALFWISFYFTYRMRYQEILARRVYTLQKNSANVCEPGSFVGEAWNALLGLVKIKDKDECLRKFEDHLIEPLYELNPLDVVAEVLTNFILTPLKGIGHHTNAFFNEFFRDTPLWLTVIKLGFLLVVVILLFFFFSNYRIRTILATFEPGATPLLDYLPSRRSLLAYLEEPKTSKRKRPPMLSSSRSQPNSLQRNRPTYVEFTESDTDADVSTNNASSSETFGQLDDSLVTRRRPHKRSLSATPRTLI
uniref:Chloride channel CLIC-like protein 1 n=1 Tax=Acrobeloides nanus TaxID=290746 RepID=A0A914C2Z8_9BILA